MTAMGLLTPIFGWLAVAVLVWRACQSEPRRHRRQRRCRCDGRWVAVTSSAGDADAFGDAGLDGGG